MPLLHGGPMSCWVCRGETAFTDEYDLDWCQEHIDIHTKAWKDAIDATGQDPSF